MITTLLKISLITTIVFVIYAAFLRNIKLYKAQRFYILALSLLTLLFPLVQFLFTSKVSGNTVYLPAITVRANGLSTITSQHFINYFFLLKLIYWSGLSLFTAYYTLSLIKILFLKKNAIKDDSQKILYVKKAIAPFSFFNKIFLPEKLKYSEERYTVIKHEKAHIELFHSVDIIFISTFAIIQWFNPFVWLLLKNLKEIHEFQADEATIKSGFKVDQYCQQIVSQTLGCQVQVLVNNFNKSLTLKRLAMLTKEKVSKWAKLKITLLVPVALLFAVFLTLVQCEKEEVNIKNDQGMIRMDKIAIHSPEIPKGKDGEPCFVIVDQNANFQGGDINSFRIYVQQNVKYPAKAIIQQIEGKVIAQVLVGSDGKIENVGILRGLSPEIDKEVEKVLLASPEWEPAKLNNKNVNQLFVIPVVFKLH